MTSDNFDQHITDMLTHCQSTLCGKAKEYATDTDRLHNFKTAAALQDVSTIQALAGMMAKHTVSVYDMCKGGKYPIELWREKIGDHINYLLLLWAMVQENDTQGNRTDVPIPIPVERVEEYNELIRKYG